MTHPGYQLTEWAYTHPWLTTEAKLVLGVTLQWPERNPSNRQLADVLPINNNAIILAQTELELEGIARYERPTKRRSRTDLRFQESNRLAWVHPKAEPNRRRQDAERRAFLPPRIAERLPRGTRGKKNQRHFPLVALVYAHAQVRSGLVAIQDDAVAALLGLNTRQVATIRRELTQSGVLVKVKPIKRLGMAHRLYGINYDAARLDPNRVQRLTEFHGLLPNPKASMRVVGSKSEVALLQDLLDPLTDEARCDVLTDAQLSEGGSGEAFGVGASALIEAAKLKHSDTSFYRSREHLHTVLENVYLVPSERPLSEVRPTEGLTNKNVKRRTRGEDGLRQKDQEGQRHRRRQAPAWRIIVPEKNLGLRADDALFAQITEGLDRLQAKYGRNERDGYARDWCLACGASGKTFLKLMQTNFHWLKPRRVEPAPGETDRSAEVAAMLAAPHSDESGVWPEE